MLFIITITMAGLSMVVLHALERNPWGTFSVGITIPIAMGVGIFYKKTGNLKLCTTIGFILLMIGVFVGPMIQDTVLGNWLTLDTKTLAIILPIYAFFAAALPVWLLLAPRDYLSSFMKIGVFIALIIGVFIINPAIEFPAFTEFVNGGDQLSQDQYGRLFPLRLHVVLFPDFMPLSALAQHQRCLISGVILKSLVLVRCLSNV